MWGIFRAFLERPVGSTQELMVACTRMAAGKRSEEILDAFWIEHP